MHAWIRTCCCWLGVLRRYWYVVCHLPLADTACFPCECATQLLAPGCAALRERARDWTFNIGYQSRIIIKCASGQSDNLSRALQLLDAFTWELATGGDLDVRLHHLHLTGAVTEALVHLPRFTHPTTLTFDNCKWLDPETDLYSYEGVPAIIPTCYDTWRICGQSCPKVEVVMAFIEYAGLRKDAPELLKLIVHHGVQSGYSDEQRSMVEFELAEVGRHVESLEWVMSED